MQYVFEAGYAVDSASYNGDAPLRPVARLGAAATSERYHIPANCISAVATVPRPAVPAATTRS